MEQKSVWYEKYLVPLFFFIFGAMVLAPALGGYYFLDDFDYLDGALKMRHQFQEGVGAIGDIFKFDFIRIDGDPYMHYRPGGYLLTTILVFLGGTDVTSFHIFGVFAHLIITILFYYFASTLLNDARMGFWAAFIFLCQDWVIHAVIWPITAILYLPSALFYLISIFLFIKYIESNNRVLLPFSAASLFLSFPFHQGSYMTILVIFAYYLFGDHKRKQKPLWLFFARPMFYLYYLAFIAWEWIQASQNPVVGVRPILIGLKSRLSWHYSAQMLSNILAYFANEVERLLHLRVDTMSNTAVAYLYFGLVILFVCATLVVFISKSSRNLRFVGLWLLIETIPRYFVGGFAARGFYSIAFPAVIMLVIAVFYVSGKLTEWLKLSRQKTAIVAVLASLIVLLQVYRAEAYINMWNRMTRGFEQETKQLIDQSGHVGRGDTFILMAPTKEQDEMIPKDHHTKRIKAILDDYTANVRFMPFDSTEASAESVSPGYHVMVGTPGSYHPYSPELNLEDLIPGDLQRQYEKYLQQKRKAAKQRAMFPWSANAEKDSTSRIQ